MSLLERLAPWRVLAKELSAFVVVGGLTFLLDVGVYQLCYATFGVGAVTSKVISTVVAALVAYVMHRQWSFSHRTRPGVKQELPLFVLLNGIALLISMGIIAAARYGLGLENVYQLQAANVFSIAVATVFRYFAYKRWVFTR